MAFKRIKTNIDISKVNPPSKLEIDELLKLKVDRAFRSIGLTNKLKNRIWFSDFDEQGVKNVIRFQLTKGFGAVFVFGKCFKFLPTISNSKRLINHKTDKSTTVHLFDYSSSITVSKNFIKRKPLQLSVMNYSYLSDGLDTFVRKGIKEIDHWFHNNQSIQDCINTSLQQIYLAEEYAFRSPNQNYILSYLFSKTGDLKAREHHLNKFLDSRYELLDHSIETTIRKNLDLLANNLHDA